MKIPKKLLEKLPVKSFSTLHVPADIQLEILENVPIWAMNQPLVLNLYH